MLPCWFLLHGLAGPPCSACIMGTCFGCGCGTELLLSLPLPESAEEGLVGEGLMPACKTAQQAGP